VRAVGLLGGCRIYEHIVNEHQSLPRFGSALDFDVDHLARRNFPGNKPAVRSWRNCVQ
jgi:hypothetical protein